MNKKNKFMKNLPFFICSIFAVVVLGCYALAVARFHVRALRAGAVAVLIYAAVALTVFLISRGRNAPVISGEDKQVLSRAVFDSLDKTVSPVLICRQDGRIVWCNSALGSALPDVKRPVGKTLSEVLGITSDQFRDAEESGDLTFEIGNEYYIANVQPIKSSRGDVLIVSAPATGFKAATDELSLFRQRIEESEPVVAYVFIDNLSELAQNEGESFRPAATKIDEFLREWATDVNGIIKEFERDRYLLIFEKRFLDRYKETKFDVLDSIRDIRVGNDRLPVTVSMGIASVRGEFAEKDKAARAALDMALGRGGDQVVVRSDETTEFFGGRTKASQRRSGVKSRVVSNELLMHISRSSGVFIMGHKYPDYDSVGACVGLSRVAEFCGVDVHIVADPKDPNVALCRTLYDGDPEIPDELFITSEAALDSVRTDSFVIMTDVNNIDISECPELIGVCGGYAVIDHHRKHAEFSRRPSIEYIETKASSACELVAEMMEQVLPAGFVGTGEADLMLAGIILDTKKFTRSTGARTYGAALYLHDNGATPEAVQELFKSGLDSFVKEAKFRSGVRVYRQCTAITVCETDGEGGTADKVLASTVADNLIGVRGIKAAFAIVRLADVIHISARSAGDVNVQLILEKLEGGGHFDTAGTQLRGCTAEEAETRLKAAIDDYFDNEA